VHDPPNGGPVDRTLVLLDGAHGEEPSVATHVKQDTREVRRLFPLALVRGFGYSPTQTRRRSTERLVSPASAAYVS
jgi:hypothetical protein